MILREDASTMGYGARPTSIKAAMHAIHGLQSCAAIVARRSRRASVLLLEDDIDLLTILTRMLMASGCLVTASQLGEHAIGALTSSQRVDLVIADLVLPGMNGTEFCNRAARIRPEMPFVVIASSDAGVDLAQFPPKTDAIYKPFRRSEALALINSKLG